MVLLSASVCSIRKPLRVYKANAQSHGLRYKLAKSQNIFFEVRRNRTVKVSRIDVDGWAPLVYFLGI